jgi:integrase
VAYVYKKTRTAPDGRTVTARTYTCVFKDPTRPPPHRGTAPGYRDKQASEAKARKLEAEAARRAEGLPVTDATHRARPLLTDVHPEYLADLATRGLSKAHRDDCRKMIKRAVRLCRWRTLGDVAAARMKKLMAALRRTGRSVRTANAYLTLVRGLTRWCVEQGYLPADPLAAIRPLRQPRGTERPHRRAAYTPDELARLLAAAPGGRARAYAAAAYSGLRRVELRRLQPRDVHLSDPARPQWALRPEVSKNRHAYTLPMLPEAAAVLRDVLAAHAGGPCDPLFPTVPRVQTLYADLAAAGVPRVRPDGRKLDFHALRYFFATQMANRLPIQKVKVLMRHRTIQMTIDLYADLGLEDVGDDVWTLPPLSGGTAP